MIDALPARLRAALNRALTHALDRARDRALNHAPVDTPIGATGLRRAYPILLAAVLILVPAACGAQSSDPLPSYIDPDTSIVVDVVEFAEVPDHANGTARMMRLVDEPGTGRMFVSDMWGVIHSVSYDGTEVAPYLELTINVEAGGRERGFQSFAFHPEFGVEGAAGYGKFYTWTDVSDTSPDADFEPGSGDSSHHTVLHEWTANDPAADRYDGGPPRELMRLDQPYGNHNAGLISFHPYAEPGDPDWGLLYIGSADGGSGGDPLNLAQDLGRAFGKILRIDPLGSNSANGQYGIPDDNPFVDDPDALDEIWAYGMRNPQRFGWDSANGNMFVAEIGQNTLEWVSRVTRGANLGWNDWEGSYRFLSRSGVGTEDPRSDPDVNYAIVEYSRNDPLMGGRVAATGIHVPRTDRIPQLQGLVLFGDFPSGELLYFDADNLPDGGSEGIGRILLRHEGQIHTFLELIRQKNQEQGVQPASRADLRYGIGPDERIFLLNKHDGTIREIVPGA